MDLVDPGLAGRLAAALADVPGLELVAGPDEEPDCLLVAPPEAPGDVALTARELEVLALLAEGASNKLIARRLGISAHTANVHVASLLEKLDAVSRTDAVSSSRADRRAAALRPRRQGQM